MAACCTHKSRDLTGDADWLVALTTHVTRGKDPADQFLAKLSTAMMAVEAV